MSHIPVGNLYRDYQNYADLQEQTDRYEESAAANTNIRYIYAELCRVYALMENIMESEKYRQYAFEFAEQSDDEQLSDYVNTLFINSDEK